MRAKLGGIWIVDKPWIPDKLSFAALARDEEKVFRDDAILVLLAA